MTKMACRDYAVMTVDLEYDWETNNKENLELIPRLLSLFDRYRVRATFFVLGKICEEHPELVRKISKKHEIAVHGYSHEDIGKMNMDQLSEFMGLAFQSFKKNNISVQGFRAPFFISNNALGRQLKEHGCVYDSSFSCFFPGRYFNILPSKTPYHASSQNLKIRGSDIIEMPIPSFFPFFPPSGFPMYRLLWPISKLFPIKYMFYLHPCEFLEKGPGKELSFFVRHLYSRNHGEKAWKILEYLLKKSKKKNVRWISCSDYLKHIRLNP
jgi:hypothetical protein